MHRIAYAAALAGILIAGCAGPAPSGFSKGDRWSVPLVGALEGGVLLVPASINGKGPYLFIVDPDAPTSVIDQQIIDEAKLELTQGPARVDETGVAQNRGYAVVSNWKIGDLSIDRRQVMAVPSDFYNIAGRRVNGVIGRDVIADRLVFGFDRDQGLVTLSTAAVFTPPPSATVIKYEAAVADPTAAATGGGKPAMTGAKSDDIRANQAEGIGLDVTTVPRRVTTAQINGSSVKLHLDLGEPVSQLRQPLWAAAKLTPAEAKLRLVDEAGSVREVASAAPGDASVAGATGHATFAPYVDQRFGAKKLDGSLGLDFFRGYAVYANWAVSTIYLRPRGEPAATAVARLGRWGAELPKCAHPGCVTATLTTTDGGIKLDVARDPEAAKRPLEIYLGITPAAGHQAANLLAELPANAESISGAVPRDYEGATITVLDVSPFLRPCQGDAGCVFDIPAQ